MANICYVLIIFIILAKVIIHQINKKDCRNALKTGEQKLKSKVLENIKIMQKNISC